VNAVVGLVMADSQRREALGKHFHHGKKDLSTVQAMAIAIETLNETKRTERGIKDHIL
jgi:hypothetical protein